MAIDTSQFEKKSIIEMSPIELMMMATQKLMNEGSADKEIIDQSITVLHRLIPECMIENEASKLRVLTKNISKTLNHYRRFPTNKHLKDFLWLREPLLTK